MKTTNFLGAVIFAAILFLGLAPFYPFAGALLAGGALLMPFIKLPAGILAIGAAGAAEELNATELALVEKLKANMNKDITAAVANDPTVKAFTELSEKLKNAKTEEEITALKAAVEKLGLDMKASAENVNKKFSEGKSFNEDIMGGFVKMLTAENISKMQKGEWGTKAMEIKSATTMLTSAISASSGTTPFSLAQFIPKPFDIQRRNPFVIQLINTMRVITKTIVWVNQISPQGAVTGTAEGSGKPELSWAYQEAKADTIKYPAYVKVSTEMLDDFAYMENAIRTQLMQLVMLKMDLDVLTGAGTSTAINGIITQAIANTASNWTGGVFAGADSFANYFDVLKIGINQVATNAGGDSSYSAGFEANIILMHPTDLTAMLIAKDTQGRYLRDLLTYPSSNVIEIDGVRIVTSTGVPQGYFVIMDASKVNFGLREDAMISIGYDGNDFTNNLITFRCEARGVCWIPTNYLGAVVYGNFTTAVASLRNVNS